MSRIADVLFVIVVVLLTALLWVGVYKQSVVMMVIPAVILTGFALITIWFKTGD